MQERKYIEIPSIRIPLWWPKGLMSWHDWLPSRGNVIFTLLMIGLLLWAQTAGAVPLGLPNVATNAATGTIAYQGRLADADGTPVTATVNMVFRLYNQATGGAPLWEEQWTGSNAVQVSDGLFNVMLGSLTPIPQSVITGNGSLFLGITVGTDDEMSPRVQLGNVPWAVQALTVPDGSITTEKIADGAVTRLWFARGTADATTNSLSWGTLPGMSLNFSTLGGKIQIDFDTGFAVIGNPTSGYVGFQLVIDDQPVIQRAQRADVFGESTNVHLSWVADLPAGIHKAEIKWRVSSTALSARINANTNLWEKSVLIVREYRK